MKLIVAWERKLVIFFTKGNKNWMSPWKTTILVIQKIKPCLLRTISHIESNRLSDAPLTQKLCDAMRQFFRRNINGFFVHLCSSTIFQTHLWRLGNFSNESRIYFRGFRVSVTSRSQARPHFSVWIKWNSPQTDWSSRNFKLSADVRLGFKFNFLVKSRSINILKNS